MLIIIISLSKNFSVFMVENYDTKSGGVKNDNCFERNKNFAFVLIISWAVSVLAME